MPKIVFELDQEAKNFGEAKAPISNSLHEALAKAIHEGDNDARAWLTENVIDIQLVEG